MRTRYIIVTLALGLAAGAIPPLRSVAVPKLAQSPSLASLLESFPPAGFAPVEGFVQHDPREGVPVSQPTRAFLAYDNRDFYVVFDCRDADPGAIRAQITRRDDVLGDDYVGLVLDPEDDRRRAVVFMVDAGGQQQDGLLDQGMIDSQQSSISYDLQAADYTYDTNWRSRVTRLRDGYRVAIAIPFSSLRFPHRPVQSWGILLFRYIYRDGELSYWPSVTRKINGLLRQEGTAGGLSGLEAPHNLEFIPYGVFRANHSLNTDTGQFADHRLQQRYGLDTKYTFLTDMNLDLTLNPDFSEVESDSPLPTTNQRFEVVYPEKRPFFEERSDIFNAPGNELFFSRRILDPEYGGRLTGKQGGTTVGLLWTDDRGPGELVAGGDPRFGHRAYFGTARVTEDIFSDSSVGALWTSRRFMDRENDVFEADTNLRLSRSLRFSGAAQESFTRGHDLASEQDPTAASLFSNPPPSRMAGAPAYYGNLSFATKDWQGDVNYNDISPNFQDDLGYIPRTDIRDVHADIYRNFFGRRYFALFQPQLHLRRNYDHSGVVQDVTIEPGIYVMFPHNTDAEYLLDDRFERYLGVGYRHHAQTIGFDVPWRTWFKLSGGEEIGTNINFFPAAGVAPFVGNFLLQELSLDLRPTPRLDITNLYFQNRLVTSGRTGQPAGRNIFNENIWRSEWLYQFNRALSFRYILQYQNSLPNASLTASPYQKQLDFDGLLTYLVTPGTAVYLGYDSLNENFVRPLTLGPEGLLRGPDFLNDGRVLFLKVSYLWRY